MLPLPPPESMSEMPCFLISGAGGCLVGWEDDPASDMPTRRWRLVAGRVDTPSFDRRIIFTQTINRDDQVQMTGDYLRDDEVLLHKRYAGFSNSLCWAGFIEMTTKTIALADGHCLVVKRRPCAYQVYGLRMPAWDK